MCLLLWISLECSMSAYVLRKADRRSRVKSNGHSIESYTSIGAGVSCDCHFVWLKMERNKLHSKCHKYWMFTCHKSISIYCSCPLVARSSRIFVYRFSHKNLMLEMRGKIGTCWVRKIWTSWSHTYKSSRTADEPQSTPFEQSSTQSRDSQSNPALHFGFCFFCDRFMKVQTWRIHSIRAYLDCGVRRCLTPLSVCHPLISCTIFNFNNNLFSIG